MPVDTALVWHEVRDFTPGLWTKNKALMPPTAAQTMTDCYAVPTGGLRAFFAATAGPGTTGIGSLSAEAPRGIFAHDNVDALGNNDYYLVTYNSSDTKVRVYQQNRAASATTWTNVKTFAGGSDPGFVSMCAYKLAAGDLYFVVSVGASQGADSGVWGFRHSDGHQTHISSNPYGYVANYQSRLICSNGASIAYTDPGVLANIDVNTAPVDVNTGQPNIMFFQPFSPGDLLVFKEGAAAYLVEGDLFNYTLQQMNASKPVRLGGPAITQGPLGVIFRAAFDGIYETQDGSLFNPLSSPLSGEEFNTLEPLAWLHHWLICGENGRMMDYDTKAWFTVSAFSAGSACMFPLQRTGNFIFTNNSSPFTLGIIEPIDGDTASRVGTYTWQSAPLRDPQGRQIEVREVQIYAQSFNGATSSITVTVNGVGRTMLCNTDDNNKAPIQFYFLARNTELDVTITAASNSAGVEAPLIDTVRIGTRTGHFLRQGTPQ